MQFRATFLFTALFLCIGSQTIATPKNVIIIRHAEKVPGQNHLDLKGYERAGALAYYFKGTPEYNSPPISHVFAMGLVNADSSIRPIETCTPVAGHLNLKLNIDYNPTQINEMAKDILSNSKYDGSTVLVCMDHGKIAKLSVALGAEDPGFWPKDVFDQVYLISFEKSSKPKLQKILQRLMFRDRETFDSPEPPIPAAVNNFEDEE